MNAIVCYICVLVPISIGHRLASQDINKQKSHWISTCTVCLSVCLSSLYAFWLLTKISMHFLSPSIHATKPVQSNLNLIMLELPGVQKYYL